MKVIRKIKEMCTGWGQIGKIIVEEERCTICKQVKKCIYINDSEYEGAPTCPDCITKESEVYQFVEQYIRSCTKLNDRSEPHKGDKMEITIEIKSGAKFNEMVTKTDIQKNIDALSRAIEGKPRASDFVLLIDTKSILEGIQQQLQD